MSSKLTYFEGHYTDDNSPCSGYLYEHDEAHPDEDIDNQIFFYGVSRSEAVEAMNSGDEVGGLFKITHVG